MKTCIRYIPCFFLCFSSFLFSQDELKQQYDFAKELFDQEKYFDAVTELKRLQLFDENKELIYESNMLMGQAFKAGAKLNEAIQHFTMAEINSKTENEFYNSRIELIRSNILRRTTSQALKLLKNLEEDNRFPGKEDEINYWRGWANIFAGNYENAAEDFSKIDPEHELKKLSQNVNEKKYSEKLAKIMSVFIPGSGQIYTGNYINGIISFGWNLLSGYLTVNAFIEERVFDGILIGNLFWLRFYIGNIQNAEEFAREKNLKITNDALNFLQYEFKGIKP